jgi:hypothetical protein
VKKICCPAFFSSHKYHEIKNILFLAGEEKTLGQFTKNYRTFYQKMSLSSQKYGFGIRDPGSGKNLRRENLTKRPFY